MSLAAVTITIDCIDARALAGWYVDTLGGETLRDGGTFVLTRLEGVGINVGFQQVPESKGAKNRVHLDFMAADRAAEVQRLAAAGATEVEERSMPPYIWTVLLDPQGNELCVLQQPDS